MLSRVITKESLQKLDRALLKIRNLPSLPSIIEEVDDVIQDPGSSASQLSRIISKDQGLSAKILTVANSPLYGFPRRVSTIDFAIVILGFNHIRNIVLAFSILESYSGFYSEKFNHRKYFIHSIMTGTIARRISVDLGYPNSGEAFTSGLLHDLGIAIINRHFPDDFAQIVDMTEDETIKLIDAEVEVLGFNHAAVGARLLEKWNLPTALTNSVLYHHKPSEAEEHRVLSSIVHLADYLTNRFNVGDFNLNNVESELDMAIIDILKLGNQEYLEKYISSYELLLQNQIQLINI